jgi:hypothetical protein
MYNPKKVDPKLTPPRIIAVTKVGKSARHISQSRQRHTEGVLNSNACENGGAIVEEVICAGQLLKGL